MRRFHWGKRTELVLCCAGLIALALACAAMPRPDTRDASVQSAAQTAAPAAAQDPLNEFREERRENRDTQLRQLREAARDEALDGEIRLQAGRQMLMLTQHMEQETNLEGILRAQGFEEVVCSVGEDCVNILVKASSLTRAQTAAALDAAMRVTGQTGGSVRVIPVGE